MMKDSRNKRKTLNVGYNNNNKILLDVIEKIWNKYKETLELEIVKS